ncbi:hypothetical protein [Salinarimonas chemoclinalis]|uniref:hypothetical protein n=1 Tax=Salinarimonas chemoclinalis TaxID=3241599 RepID=UPI003557508B
MTDRNAAIATMAKVKDTLVGLAASGAMVSGWDDGQAALLGVKAEESASARIALGEDTGTALASAIGEAELVLMLDVFSRTLDETRDVGLAFAAVMGIKRAATAGVPGADEALAAAEQAFADALKGGLAPHAALASAYVSAAATARLSSASTN